MEFSSGTFRIISDLEIGFPAFEMALFHFRNKYQGCGNYGNVDIAEIVEFSEICRDRENALKSRENYAKSTIS